MKKILAMTIAMVLMLVSVSALAADITVTVNGEAVEFDQQPVVEDAKLLLPFRFIAEKLGANVSWYEDAEGAIPIQQVLSQINGIVTVMQIGNSNIFVDGNAVSLEAAPKIIGDRTLVTIPAIESALGVSVAWDEANSAVTVTSVVDEK